MRTNNFTREIRKAASKKDLGVRRVSVVDTSATYMFYDANGEHGELFGVEMTVDLKGYQKEFLKPLIEKAYYWTQKQEKEFNSKMKKFTDKGYVIRAEE